MSTRPKVVITDETLRDGLQIERLGVTLDEKLKLIDMLVAAGVKRLVVGAFVNPKWSPQMADTEQLVRRLKPRDGVDYFALALNDRGREIRQRVFAAAQCRSDADDASASLRGVPAAQHQPADRGPGADLACADRGRARRGRPRSGDGAERGMGLELARRVHARAPHRRRSTASGRPGTRPAFPWCVSTWPIRWPGTRPPASPRICWPSRRAIRRCGSFVCTYTTRAAWRCCRPMRR